MTSTHPPRNRAERQQYLEAELRTARHCLDCDRLEDAIALLVAALIQLGAIRSRYRMLSVPDSGES